MINYRISEIANLINNANIVVDVGSDHALLSILLIEKKRSKKVINIEKNLKPFEQSKKNTLKYKNEITNILSDGFEKFDPNIHINYLVISGLGSNTILKILGKCKNKVDNLILCSNNNEHLIRFFAKKNKYFIKEDKTIIDNNFFYSLLWLSKKEGKKIFLNRTCYLGIKKIKKNDKNYFKYLEYKIKNLNKIKNLDKKNKKKYQELKWYQKQLKTLQ